MLAACLEREDVRDVFISRKARSLAELPQGATLGTASLRRQAIAKRARGDLRVVPLRGNVETRLRKLDAGEVDATILALAGLKRLGLTRHATKIMSTEEFLPAVGQGAIGIEARANDARTRELLARIDHADTSTALACERAFLAVLDGSCKTPIGGHADISGDTIHFRGLLAHPDGDPSCEHSDARAARRRDQDRHGSRARTSSARLAGPAILYGLNHAPRRHPPAGRQRTHRRRLRARGHDVLVAPLMRVEPVAADLSGGWGGVIITSANAPGAIAGNPARAALVKLPLFAVGRRSADAARQAGFADVTSAGGDVRDLVQLIAERHADAAAPLLYLAGEDRAADLVGELAVHGIAAEMVVVYRAVTAPFPPELTAALKAGAVDARAAFFQAQRRELHRRRPSGGHHRTGVGGATFLPGAADRRAAFRRRRRQHRRGKAAGRGGADRASGAGPGLIGAPAPFALFAAAGGPIRRGTPWQISARRRKRPQEPNKPRNKTRPQGPRRKKRAAPTIDLTATEMPPPQSDPPPAPAQEPPPAGARTAVRACEGRARRTAILRRGGPIGAALLAGVAGGAIVTLALFALWLTGLVPVRYAASTDTSAQVAALEAQVRDLKSRPAGDNKAVDALGQRVSKIEEAIAKLPASDAGGGRAAGRRR